MINGWHQVNRYGLSNPVTVWTKRYPIGHGYHDVSIRLSLHGKRKMVWELMIGKPSGFTEKKTFKTDELAQAYAKKYMERN